jgi:paraquat-inducible protein B
VIEWVAAVAATKAIGSLAKAVRIAFDGYQSVSLGLEENCRKEKIGELLKAAHNLNNVKLDANGVFEKFVTQHRENSSKTGDVTWNNVKDSFDEVGPLLADLIQKISASLNELVASGRFSVAEDLTSQLKEQEELYKKINQLPMPTKKKELKLAKKFAKQLEELRKKVVETEGAINK